MDDVSRPEVGQLRERPFIERLTVAEPCRQLDTLPAISARKAQRRTARGLESTVGVDPFQRVRGPLASRQGRREGANKLGRNGVFGLSNFRPRRHGHYGRGAYWRCPSSSKECRTTDKFRRRVPEGGF